MRIQMNFISDHGELLGQSFSFLLEEIISEWGP